MLDALTGKAVQIEADYAIVAVGGFRFRCEISNVSAGILKETNGDVTVYTRLQMNTNEGTFVLFGFATELERECFDIFTSISGIGPRKGLMILSQVDIAPLAHAIVTNDIDYLSKIKGVGRKTAERLVVELREKMIPYAADTKKKAAVPQHIQDAMDAMMALGCKPQVAERAVGEAIKILGESASTEELVRAALRFR